MARPSTKLLSRGNPSRLWTQLPAESGAAYQAFLSYRNLGTARSVCAAYRAAKDKPDATQANGQWNAWCRQFHWRQRAEAWDAELDRIRDDATADEVARMAARHARMAVGFQAKLIRRLEQLNADELTPTTLVRWFEVAVKLERLARGTSPAQVGPVDRDTGGGPSEPRADDAVASEAVAAAERAFYKHLYGRIP